MDGGFFMMTFLRVLSAVAAFVLLAAVANSFSSPVSLGIALGAVSAGDSRRGMIFMVVCIVCTVGLVSSLSADAQEDAQEQKHNARISLASLSKNIERICGDEAARSFSNKTTQVAERTENWNEDKIKESFINFVSDPRQCP
jgi:hypothetical protein